MRLRRVDSLIGMRSILAIAFLVLTARPIFAQTPSPSAASSKTGTVNVLLANKNGLVAVTDSRLSSGGVPAGVGQKLFVLDDHTICTIAGWFSLLGPSMDGKSRPLYTAIPNLVSNFAGKPFLAGKSLDKKVELLSGLIAYTLGALESLSQSAGSEIGNEPPELTVASFEDGAVRIAQVEFVRTQKDGALIYQVQRKPIVTVGGHFVYVLAGIRPDSEAILSGRRTISNDPILAYYQESLQSGHLDSLSLEDMERVAKTTARYNARKYPRIIGEPLQIATIENGDARIVQQTIAPPPQGDIVPGMILLIHGGGIAHARYTSAFDVRGAALIADQVTISDSLQTLDRVFFMRSTFDHCTLRYNGSSNFMLDPSNTIRDSTLELEGGVNANSPVVQKLLQQFPGLTLSDAGRSDHQVGSQK